MLFGWQERPLHEIYDVYKANCCDSPDETYIDLCVTALKLVGRPLGKRNLAKVVGELAICIEVYEACLNEGQLYYDRETNTIGLRRLAL
jgi:hypothetical protein